MHYVLVWTLIVLFWALLIADIIALVLMLTR